MRESIQFLFVLTPKTKKDLNTFIPRKTKVLFLSCKNATSGKQIIYISLSMSHYCDILLI